jgi:hypothetical protein
VTQTSCVRESSNESPDPQAKPTPPTALPRLPAVLIGLGFKPEGVPSYFKLWQLAASGAIPHQVRNGRIFADPAEVARAMGLELVEPK